MIWRERALKHAIAEMPNESCGLVIREDGVERYWPCRNISSEPEKTFVLDPEDWVKAEDMAEVIAVVHSHPTGAPDPSDADIQACNASWLPWEIVSPETGEWASCKPTSVTPLATHP
tara:strand:+ start:5650 stop:6000 length:351 start_codon:yes stop_codon:yes gene_type:complete